VHAWSQPRIEMHTSLADLFLAYCMKYNTVHVPANSVPVGSICSSYVLGIIRYVHSVFCHFDIFINYSLYFIFLIYLLNMCICCTLELFPVSNAVMYAFYFTKLSKLEICGKMVV
jgi:hypothetical protein